MDRRNFIGGLFSTAAGLVLPYEPKRIYSFASARYIRACQLTREFLHRHLILEETVPYQVAEIMKWSEDAHDAIALMFDTPLICRPDGHPYGIMRNVAYEGAKYGGAFVLDTGRYNIGDRIRREQLSYD